MDTFELIASSYCLVITTQSAYTYCTTYLASYMLKFIYHITDIVKLRGLGLTYKSILMVKFFLSVASNFCTANTDS